MSWKDCWKGEDAESDVRDLDAEQPDAEWLDAESDRRRAAFDARRATERVQRHERRAKTPLSVRLFAVEKAFALTSTLPAVKGGSGGSRADTMAPPRSDPYEAAGEDRDEVARLVRLITDAVGKLEQVVDVHRGLASPRQGQFGSDLDKLLAERFRGYPPEDVSAIEPLLGSPAAVRRSRELMNLHRETGDPMPRKED